MELFLQFLELRERKSFLFSMNLLIPMIFVNNQNLALMKLRNLTDWKLYLYKSIIDCWYSTKYSQIFSIKGKSRIEILYTSKNFEMTSFGHFFKIKLNSKMISPSKLKLLFVLSDYFLGHRLVCHGIRTQRQRRAWSTQ